MPCLASGACTMSGRGLWIAVPQSAAGGSSQNDSPAIRDIEHPAPYTGPVSGLVISQRSLQIELIFRLLLKITVERPHECDFDLISVRREAVKPNAYPCPITSRRASSHPYRDRCRLSPGCWAGPRPPVTQVGTKATRIWRLCVTLGLSRASRVCPIQGSGQYWGLREGAGLRVV